MENDKNIPNGEHSKNPQDWLNASFLFAKALNMILNPNEGIVVDVDENMSLPETKKVIVYKTDNQIHIYDCQDDYEQGTIVNGSPNDDKQD